MTEENIFLDTDSDKSNNALNCVCDEKMKDDVCFFDDLIDRERDLNTPDISDRNKLDSNCPKDSDISKAFSGDHNDSTQQTKEKLDTEEISNLKISAVEAENSSEEVKTKLAETSQEITPQVLSISDNDDEDDDNYSATTEIVKIPPICDICNKWFTKKSSLKTHYQIHAGVKPYICEICFKTFSKKSILDTHSLIHTGERNFLCEICDKRFARKTDLQKHLLIHTDKKPYVCDLCEKSFNHKSNLRKHQFTHSKEKRHVCSICRQAFALKDVLLNHLKNHYMEEYVKPGGNNDREKLRVKNYLKTIIKKNFHKCNECDKLFLRKDRLMKHKLTHKSDYGMTHICEVCNARFISKDTLQEHLLNHVVLTFNNDTFDPLDDINSTLTLDGDDFDLLDDLNFANSLDADTNINIDMFDDINFPNSPVSDQPVQSSKKDKTCDVCFKTFTRKSSLTDHYLIHSGEKPHKCKMCEKSFSQKVTLNRHLLTHSGARPFKCKICSKNFARKTSLRKHYISHSAKKLF